MASASQAKVWPCRRLNALLSVSLKVRCCLRRVFSVRQCAAQNIIVEVFRQNARPQQTIQCLAPEELRSEVQGSLDIAQTHQNHGLDRQADGHRALIEILRHHPVNTLDQPQMVHAFYGVRTGFIRRGGVSFFTWLGQLASVVVSFQERCILDDWGAECRIKSRLQFGFQWKIS